MKKKFFYKEVNKQSRKEMAFYIKNHFTYNRLNSWNNWKGYANNVKIYYLGLTKEQEEKAYNLFFNDKIDASNFWSIVEIHLEYFRDTTGHQAYFNGRSDGYIVFDKYVLDYEVLKVMSLQELQEVTETLQKFDRLCDNLRDELIWYLDNARMEEETIIKTKKVLTI
ncbi:hypothetical protein ACLGL2_01065 [Parvimonas sp. G1641]|uniref:hypothetical protein n=1 Tax=Parvimonas sp. G1641 TaxID=3388846 RepID=UPI00398103FE